MIKKINEDIEHYEIDYNIGFPEDRTRRHHWRIYEYVRDNFIKKDDNITDLGCGSGFGLRVLNEKVDGGLVGVDYSIAAINYAKKYNFDEKSIFILDDLNNYIKKPLYKTKIVLMIESLEHTKNPKEVVEIIFKEFLSKLFIATFPVHKEGHPLQEGHHQHEFTVSRIKNVFKDFNYKIKYFYFDGLNLLEVDESYPDNPKDFPATGMVIIEK